FFQAEDGIRDGHVTGVQTCALPIFNQIESIRAQLANLAKELGTDETGKAIRKAADDLAEKLTNVEGKVLQLKLTGRGQDDVRWRSEERRVGKECRSRWAGDR